MIDTHAYYQTLKDAGFDDRQAEAMTKGMTGIVYGTLATKSDVVDLRVELRTEIGNVRVEIADVRTEMAGLRGELKTDIAHLRTELKNDIALLRTELKDDITQSMHRTVGMLATYTTLVVGVATVVNHFVH
jgi:hypothetical protein